MKIITIVLLFAFFCFGSISSSDARLFGNSGLKEANELIKINRFKEAHEKLDAAVLANPGDPRIHYEVGLAYARMGWDSHADASFDNVYRVGNNRYLGQISELYKSQAYILLKQGRIDLATHKFKRAFFFHPQNKNQVISELFAIGKNFAANNLYGDAYHHFRTAANLDPSMGDKIADIYFEACNESAKPCFNFYRRAHEFSPKHDKEIVQMLYALYHAEDIADHQKKDIKQEIAYYVKGETFTKLFPPPPPPPPDFVVYHPGTYTFSLKAGEMTDHWIMFPAGRNNMGSFSSPDFNYELIFDDGDIVKGDPNAIIPRKNRAKLKIRAISEQPNIKLIVK